MTLFDRGEFGFIEQLRQMASGAAPGLAVAIGDDCALIEVGDDRLAVSTDAMVEGRHFRLDWLTAREVGARAMAAALSDVAAMAPRPSTALSRWGCRPIGRPNAPWSWRGAWLSRPGPMAPSWPAETPSRPTRPL